MAYEEYDIKVIHGEYEPDPNRDRSKTWFLDFLALFMPWQWALRIDVAIYNVYFAISTVVLTIGFFIALPFMCLYWLCWPPACRRMKQRQQERKKKEEIRKNSR